jgi:hypothetical protein
VTASQGATLDVGARSDSYRPLGDGLGWLPRLAVLTAFGLLLVAAGNTLSRYSVNGFEWLYYPGLALVIAPNAMRLLRPEPRRSERIGLVMVLGGALYLVKVLHDPLAFTFSDEFIQLRNILDAIASNHLFTRNPLLPTTTYYPGLQSVAASVAKVSGLGPFPSGIIVLGAARLVMALSIYIFFELVGRSSRLAGIAALLYMANPNFIFFGGQVAYESLALPLAVMVLVIAAGRSGLAAFGNPADRSLRWSLTVMAVLAIGAITVTHHVTSVALAGFLTVWTIVAWLTRKRREDGPGPADLAIVAIAAVAIWSLTVASPVIAYLGPVLGRAISNGISLLTLQSVPRNLFTSGNGAVAPLWERLASFAAVAFVLVGLLVGWIRVWAAHRREALIVTLALGTLLYPATLVLRLTPDGAETANRSSEFLFIAIGLIVALGVSELWLRGLPSIRRVSLFAGAATVMIIGGFLIGWPIWGRFPGPFVISADSRSVDSEGIAAAQWSLASLGPNNRQVADRSQRLLQGTYGLQQAVTGYGNTYIDNNQSPEFSSCPDLKALNEANTNCVSVDSKSLIITPSLGSSEQAVAFDGDIHYVVFDRRIFAGLPASGIYVERGEVSQNGGPLDLTDPDQAIRNAQGQVTTPAGPPGSGPGPTQQAQIQNHQDRLDKWDGGPGVPGMPGVDRVYDSGNIQIYNISVWASWKG